jgi:hypothetical protein
VTSIVKVLIFNDYIIRDRNDKSLLHSLLSNFDISGNLDKIEALTEVGVPCSGGQ